MPREGRRQSPCSGRTARPAAETVGGRLGVQRGQCSEGAMGADRKKAECHAERGLEARGASGEGGEGRAFCSEEPACAEAGVPTAKLHGEQARLGGQGRSVW